MKRYLAALLLFPLLAWGQNSIDDFAEQPSPSTSDWLLIDEGSGVFKSSTIANVVDARATGEQVMWIPAGAMTPLTTNGSASLATTEISAGNIDIQTLDFSDGSTEKATFWVAFPAAWDEGDISYQVYWTSTATDTDAVVWRLFCWAFSDNEALSQTPTNIDSVTDAAQGAANEVLISAESAQGTIAGTPASGDLVSCTTVRVGGDASDTHAEDAKLIGIKLYWTTDQPTE